MLEQFFVGQYELKSDTKCSGVNSEWLTVAAGANQPQNDFCAVDLTPAAKEH